MILAKKIRLLPTKEQEKKMWQSVGTARYIYNWTIIRQEENYKTGGKFIYDNILSKEITKLKKTELSWLKNVSSDIPKQAIRDACNAYSRFFKKISNKPQLKRKKRSKPSFYNCSSKLKVKDKTVLLSKIGWVKILEELPICKYRNPRIIHDNKYWYLTVGVEVPEKKEKLKNISLNIDLGLKDLAICSDGKVFENINESKIVKNLEKRLNQKQKQVGKKYKINKFKTKNIEKMENKIKLIYRKLTNIRNNYLHQVTTSIVKTKPYKIIVNELNISEVKKNKELSNFIRKECFNKFKKYIEYKSQLRGIEIVFEN